MCMVCGFRNETDLFGPYVRCPLCESNQVVSADIWDRFSPVPPNQPATDKDAE